MDVAGDEGDEHRLVLLVEDEIRIGLGGQVPDPDKLLMLELDNTTVTSWSASILLSASLSLEISMLQ